LRRPRVLLVAEAANPEWVSVPLVGWSHARALARRVPAHLVTQVRNRAALLRAGLREGEDFTAIDSERLAAPVWRLASRLRGGQGQGWTTSTALASLVYPYFEHLVWRRFAADLGRGAFDVVHRITPLSPTAPSLLARRCARLGIPFVLGPLNGGVPWPAGFENVRRAEREWLSAVRGVYRLLPGYRATRAHASAILVGSIDTWRQMPARYRARCVYIPENGIDPERFRVMRTRRCARPLRVAFVGRLVPYKGADMLLDAAAPLVRAGALAITLVGDGPARGALEAQVVRESLASGVSFAGWLEHDRVQQQLAEADVLGFPSIREFGGGVVLEAMAVGLVPLVVSYGGPAELVTPETGFSVELGSREAIVAALRRTLEHLVAHPDEIDRRSAPARERVRALFTWDAKAGQVLEVYRWVRGERADRPDFGMPFPNDAPAT
jgi:glycosyltransferase involved in cell wall biosynthesis